ncbi:L-aspartate oxidase [Thermosynechococcus sp. B3]|uniref:L-aspartate oxidase n=1 Tax=unclassified Thermosynechococcus TaxID=2622553 RepID=UPI002578BCB7|nr:MULTISPECIES: L-aspartate oxidase [unclassified Thermosynechococcus]WJI25950.1 L-aspartate oxidase [Thermosynechococcus sp. B1]WJI28478.1 L-aspartate oxidase [Thermosynechococcus sp. B3]
MTPATSGFDVLIIGSGAAGLSAALALPPSYRIGLITKTDLRQSASGWAQGGMAAAIDPTDSPLLHAQDTLAAGAGLCDPVSVQFLVEQAPVQVERLLAMGVAFDRVGDRPALTLEAAHSRPRVLHAADTTGQALITTLLEQVTAAPHITLLPNSFVFDLWLESGRCCGVCLLCQGQLQWLRSGAVVLATGGGGQVFAQTTNPPLSTGDGVAMAWRAGAHIRDVEFFQFHPTALAVEGAPRFLISEAVRGEGAHLIDHTGHRFVADYHPAGELAPRDIVSRAIYRHLQQSHAPHVWLDLRPIPRDRLHYRFPKIIAVCRQWGIDVEQQPIPVSPAAHYWMGGVVTDLQAKTSLPGLYAVGEVASTGVHGANRLASNSLLECFVFSAQLAHLHPQPLPLAVSPVSQQALEIEPVSFRQWRQDLRELLWQSAGICRDAPTLMAALSQVKEWRQELLAHPIAIALRELNPNHCYTLSNTAAQTTLWEWGELRNLLDIAYLILKSALFREESRGGHYRQDYPQPDPNWQMHTLIWGEHWQKAAIQGVQSKL